MIMGIDYNWKIFKNFENKILSLTESTMEYFRIQTKGKRFSG